MLELSRGSFTLEPAAEREVEVIFAFEDTGVYSAFVSVVARPLGDRAFKAGSGVKVPVNLTVTEDVPAEEGDDPALLGIIVLDVLLFLVLFGLIVHRVRKHRALLHKPRSYVGKQ